MKWLGLIYLFGVFADGALSLVATAFRGLEGSSDNFSCVMLLLSPVVFVLAVAGKLRPRAVFIVPALLYAFFAVFGIGLGILVLVKTGGAELPEEFGAHALREMFPWYGPIEWVLLTLLTATGTVCLYKYMRSLEEPPPPPEDGLMHRGTD